MTKHRHIGRYADLRAALGFAHERQLQLPGTSPPKAGALDVLETLAVPVISLGKSSPFGSPEKGPDQESQPGFLSHPHGQSAQDADAGCRRLLDAMGAELDDPHGEFPPDELAGLGDVDWFGEE